MKPPIYCVAVDRIDVHLGEEELALLDRVSRETGSDRSELIRRAVKVAFGREGKASRSVALQSTANSRQRDGLSGSDYVDAMRNGDLNERLARLGVS